MDATGEHSLLALIGSDRQAGVCRGEDQSALEVEGASPQLDDGRIGDAVGGPQAAGVQRSRDRQEGLRQRAGVAVGA